MCVVAAVPRVVAEAVAGWLFLAAWRLCLHLHELRCGRVVTVLVLLV